LLQEKRPIKQWLCPPLFDVFWARPAAT